MTRMLECTLPVKAKNVIRYFKGGLPRQAQCDPRKTLLATRYGESFHSFKFLASKLKKVERKVGAMRGQFFESSADSFRGQI